MMPNWLKCELAPGAEACGTARVVGCQALQPRLSVMLRSMTGNDGATFSSLDADSALARQRILRRVAVSSRQFGMAVGVAE